MLIALEGIDGSGTTTQLEPLAAYFRAQHKTVYVTAEPSRGNIGKLLRSALRKEIVLPEPCLGLLFAADRLEHLQNEIEPQLKQNDVVLTDRYLLSSLAYQGHVLPMSWVEQINAFARLPDLSILLRVDIQTAAARRQQRDATVEHYDAMATQEKVATLYDTVFARKNLGATAIVNANTTIEDVTQQIIHMVAQFSFKT